MNMIKMVGNKIKVVVTRKALKKREFHSPPFCEMYELCRHVYKIHFRYKNGLLKMDIYQLDITKTLTTLTLT